MVKCTNIMLMESGRNLIQEKVLLLSILLQERISTKFKVVRSGDLVSCTAKEGVSILGEGKFLVPNSFPGNERTKYCPTSIRSLDASWKVLVLKLYQNQGVMKHQWKDVKVFSTLRTLKSQLKKKSCCGVF